MGGCVHAWIFKYCTVLSLGPWKIGPKSFKIQTSGMLKTLIKPYSVYRESMHILSV